MLTFKELRQQSGMALKEYANYFGIPYRTVQDWEYGNRRCLPYIIDLMKYKLEKENIISRE